MNQSHRRPEICSLCSLVCELPEQSPLNPSLDGFCNRRSQLHRLVELRLKSIQEHASVSYPAIAKFSDRIAQASQMLVTGRIHSVELARAAIELAKHYGATIDPWDSDRAMDAIASMQRVGGYSVSLGEAREHSDLWIVVGDDRLLEQTPRLPLAMHRGGAMRLLLLGNWSDSAVKQWQSAGFEVFCITVPLEGVPKYLSQATRLGQDHCQSQVGDWILQAKYTTILYAPSALAVTYRDLWIDLLSRWVLTRNETARIATLCWGNLQSTFHQTCTWLTGFPGRIRFEHQNPSYDPSRFSAKDWCHHHAIEDQSATGSVILWIDDSIEELPEDFIEQNIPKLIVGPNRPKTTSPSDLWLPAGIMGVSHSANVFRGDQTILANIPIRRKELQSPCLTPCDWLGRLMR
jgi:formylmethanofuran dehydrogenase subunit B